MAGGADRTTTARDGGPGAPPGPTAPRKRRSRAASRSTTRADDLVIDVERLAIDGLVIDGLVVKVDPDDDVPVDGRTARSERTRTAIVDALLSLLEEGDVLPTAPRIAERAGISLRLIYHHFGDLESLFRAVSRRQVQRMADLFEPVDVDLPLAERIEQLVAKRARINETMTPVRRASILQEPFSKHLAATRDAAYLFSQDEIEQVFATELAAFDDDERRTLVSALQGALSWGAWNDLRLSGRSEDEARAALHLMIRRLLPG